LTISTSLRNDYGCNFNEINIKYALFNYRSSMTSNGNLFQHIYYGRPFSEEQAKLIFFKILLCLNELHKNNVCHLDLELGNIMLDEYNNPVLIN
jgi:serine/threonine protein kinase